MKKYIYCFLLAIILFFFAASPVLAKEYFNYHTYTLKNGLQVIIFPNNRAPVVYHSIWYKVGSADSPSNKSGLAHFLEHMMFKGSKRFPNDTYKRTIADLGGAQNANTTWDRTGYFVTIAKDYLPLVIEMEADRMQNLDILPDDVTKEKEVVLQERRSTSDSQPFQVLNEAANASFFWQHPYGQPVIGFEEHIRSYTHHDARQLYKTWYTPENATLIIAGDVNLEALKPLIEKYYGSIPQGATSVRERPKELDHRGATAKVEIRSSQLGSYFQRFYRAPNFRTSNIEKEAALTLLQDILGDPTFGRLSQAFVQNQKLANSVNANYGTGFYDPYRFAVSGSPVNSSDLMLLEACVESEMRRLAFEGVTDTELTNAKQQWQFESLYRLDSLNGIADYFGENLSIGYSLDNIENWLDTIQKVTKSEIQQAAKEILSKDPEVTIYTHNVAPN
jgi:zinc protease